MVKAHTNVAQMITLSCGRGQKGRRKRSRKIKGHRQVQLMEKEKATWEEERGLGINLGPNLPVLEREPK